MQSTSFSDREMLPDVEAHTKNYLRHQEISHRLSAAVLALNARTNTVPAVHLGNVTVSTMILYFVGAIPPM